MMKSVNYIKLRLIESKRILFADLNNNNVKHIGAQQIVIK